MLVNTKNLISLTEANQNFSKVVRTVDEKGSVIIMKNNNPSYVVIDFKKLEELQISAKDKIETLASRILEDNFEAFKELASRWRPLLDYAHERGVAFGYELHPGSDIYDGATYEMFLDYTGDHPAACLNYDPSHFLLQQLDYLDFIRIYGDRIKGFHVKDAEFRPTGRVGVYGGYQSWAGRAGRFRSLGDGQVDFTSVFTLLTEAGYTGWAVMEWECAVKSPEQGAAEGAPFITKHLIETSDVAFDDFASSGADVEANRRILGLT